MKFIDELLAKKVADEPIIKAKKANIVPVEITPTIDIASQTCTSSPARIVNENCPVKTDDKKIINQIQQMNAKIDDQSSSLTKLTSAVLAMTKMVEQGSERIEEELIAINRRCKHLEECFNKIRRRFTTGKESSKSIKDSADEELMFKRTDREVIFILPRSKIINRFYLF